MSAYNRSLVFAAFLSSCVSLVLLAAALGTKNWIVAGAKNTHNPAKSVGKINLGLFEGEKSLNIGYGLRTYHINVMETFETEPDLLHYDLWLATVIGMTGALLFAVMSAVLSVINSATTPITTIAGIPGLYVTNVLATLFEITAVGLWLCQFFGKLQYNALGADDRKLSWTSSGMAHLAQSFWFVVASAGLHSTNVIILCCATRRRGNNNMNVLEEKGAGAIMLY